MRGLTLSLLATTVREDDLLVLVKDSRLCIRRRVTDIFVSIHQCGIPLWMPEWILKSKMAIQSVVEVFHVADDVKRQGLTVLIVVEQLLDLLVKILIGPC